MECTRIFIFLLTLICVSNALSNDEVAKAKRDEEIYLRKIYTDMDKSMKIVIRENLKSVLRFLEENSREFNISTKCKGDFFKMLGGLRDLKFWALNFIDATGKPSDGILGGNMFMYGNCDQCLNATVLKRNGSVDFHGQYCLISVATLLPKTELTPDMNNRAALVEKLTQNLTETTRLLAHTFEIQRPNGVKIGICVPSGCESNDIESFLKYAGKQVLLNLTLDFCETEDTLVFFTPTRIVIVCLYTFFIIFVIIGSVVERYIKARKISIENPVMRSLICFSLPYNFQKLISTKENEGNLTFLNGIRVLSFFYVILGHHYIVKLASSMHRNVLPKVVLTWGPRFFFQVVVNGTLALDVFFFIGGFLNCYLRAKKNFTYFSFSSSFMVLIHRLMRIYPVYIFSVLLGLLLYQRGPLAHDLMARYWKPCKTEWWRNLIFINNFNEPFNQCVPHSWYLATDMQLFLVSLFTIPLLFRNPKIGIFLNLAIILFSTAFTSFHVWAKKYPPTVIIKKDLTEKYFNDFFHELDLPTVHAPTYFGGVLLGFFMTKKTKLTLYKITLAFGWIAASAIFLTMMFITKKWMSETTSYTPLESALYFSLSKTLFSWSVGWLIFCCFVGHGGFINYILSWKIWIPLNRLCLSAYLLSVFLQFHYYANSRTPQDFQHEIEIWGFFGDLTVTCLLAVPMVLFFESPFIALEKVIFQKKENTSRMNENEMKEKEINKDENNTRRDDEEN